MAAFRYGEPELSWLVVLKVKVKPGTWYSAA